MGADLFSSPVINIIYKNHIQQWINSFISFLIFPLICCCFSVLNKLTPDKFDKLLHELLNVGIETKYILKGLILLVFEKAIDEPKYSSMYAQLCLRLSEEAPNFDDPGKTGNSVSSQSNRFITI